MRANLAMTVLGCNAQVVILGNVLGELASAELLYLMKILRINVKRNKSYYVASFMVQNMNSIPVLRGWNHDIIKYIKYIFLKNVYVIFCYAFLCFRLWLCLVKGYIYATLMFLRKIIVVCKCKGVVETKNNNIVLKIF